MCISNINANINIFSSDETGNVLSIVKQVKSIIEKDKKVLKNIAIMVNLTLLETKTENRTDQNVINSKGKLDCILRIVKENADSYSFIKLDEYTLDFSDESNFVIEESRGIKFYNIYRTLNIDSLYLMESQSNGIFTIELLLRRKVNDRYVDQDEVVQTLLNFEVV